MRIPIIFAVLALTAPAALAQNSPSIRGGDLRVLYYEPLERLQRSEQADEVVTAPGSRPGYGTLRLSFDALGREFDLELQPNARLAGVLRNYEAATARVYAGQLRNQPGSWVRITEYDNRLHGMIWDGHELYGVEPAGEVVAPSVRRSTFNPDKPLIFRLSDTLMEPGAMSCGAGNVAAPVNGLAAYNALIEELETASAMALQTLDVAMIGDFPFFQSFGSDLTTATNAIVTRMNNVDGIYTSQLEIQINVPATDIAIFQTQAEDPFTTTAAPDLLDEASDFKFANFADSGLAHLYTGRNLDGTTAGIAFIGSVCSPRFGVGVSEARRDSVTDSLVAAHEIGHNFGADHDGDPTGPCGSTPETFLMAPAINGSSTFSQCSLDTMQPIIDAATCLVPAIASDAELTGPAGSVNANFGVPFNLMFTVGSVGAGPVNDVAAGITVPAALDVLTSSVPGGSCTNGAGQVDCTLGTIPSGSQRIINLQLEPTQLGSFTVDVNLTAADDLDPTNNDDSVDITVDPIVDLVLTVQTTGNVVEGSSGTVTATVANQSSFDASAVSLQISVAAGLTVTGATSSQGNCSVMNTQINCDLGTLSGSSTSTSTITFTADTTGLKPMLFGVSSAEADSDTSNNSAQPNINVTAPGSGGAGGEQEEGGGAVGWLTLVWLFVLFARRRP